MPHWWDSTVEDNIRTILASVYYERNPRHHLGRPFLTAYQLAIEFEERFPELVNHIGLATGGRGIGVHQSLAQQLARGLSQRIRSGHIQDIEGGFLSDLHRHDISFGPAGIIRSSVGDISMFRFIDREISS